MRLRLAVLVAVTSLLTVASPVSAGPSLPPPPRGGGHVAAVDWAYVQRMLFGVSLHDFLLNAAFGDRWFDWSTDWCSAPLVGSTGLSFDFHGPCRRHDFGYRNLRLLERRYGTGHTYWNGVNRGRVDRQFLSDMRAHCTTRAPWLQLSCLGWAQTYYAAVRVAGGP